MGTGARIPARERATRTGALLTQALREAPNEVYGGLLSTLMRLVFVLYAEDRGLMPRSDVYQKHYSSQASSSGSERTRPGIRTRWTRATVRGRSCWRCSGSFTTAARHGEMRFPARHGRLFNPDAYPFLEGRPLGIARVMGDTIDPPHISDGVVFRVLKNLLILDGERLSYRALDVEQIGSVYEAMMGFALQQAAGPSIAIAPKHIVVQHRGTAGAEAEGARGVAAEGDRAEGHRRRAWRRPRRWTKSCRRLGRRCRATRRTSCRWARCTCSRPRSAGGLAPTTPRGRSPSRSSARRSDRSSSGWERTRRQSRFWISRCAIRRWDPGRFSSRRAACSPSAWCARGRRHKQTPKVPDDEDVLTYARRLVAERCLYGVDKNIFAVDLAKLSLWLATLAREHPFTFLDHALRHGDSLVGLSREQIACFNWEADKQMPLLRTLIDKRVSEAQRLREQIQGLAHVGRFRRQGAAAGARRTRRWPTCGSSATWSCPRSFEREKPKERQTLRAAYAGKVQRLAVRRRLRRS